MTRKNPPTPVNLPQTYKSMKRKPVEVNLPEDRTQLYAIADLRLRGLTRLEIADQLGISLYMVDQNNEILDELWRDVAIADIDVEKGRDIERIEKMIGSVWTRALNGNTLVIDRVIKLIERKAMMLGYDAPKKVQTSGESHVSVDVQNHSTIDISKLTDEQLDFLLQIQEAQKEPTPSPFVIEAEVREIPSDS